MWKTKKDCQKKIKEKQREMYKLFKQKGIDDPDVYIKSCELDNLIVEFMKKYNNGINNSLF